jgi:integrase
MRAMLRRKGHRDFSVHGMRSCFRDWCADTGKPFDLAEAALAHAPGDSTVQSYMRTDMLERRRVLMEAWGAYLTQVPEEKVVPLHAVWPVAAA